MKRYSYYFRQTESIHISVHNLIIKSIYKLKDVLSDLSKSLYPIFPDAKRTVAQTSAKL